uniref:Thioesterase domain-containing protein n=1 Tax=uncultured bacterium DX-7F-24 TaxID=1292054 RepID=M1KET8_9BACT|nr:hypothetical protein [uncultured bacterium DX-7F-24]
MNRHPVRICAPAIRQKPPFRIVGDLSRFPCEDHVEMHLSEDWCSAEIVGDLFPNILLLEAFAQAAATLSALRCDGGIGYVTRIADCAFLARRYSAAAVVVCARLLRQTGRSSSYDCHARQAGQVIAVARLETIRAES